MVEKGIETLEIGFPELTIALKPDVGFGKRLGCEAAGTALAIAAAGDEASAFENDEMFGNGWLAHGEGFCEFKDGGLAAGEASQDGAACGIGEGGEDGVESGCLRHFITRRLYNRMVI